MEKIHKKMKELQKLIDKHELQEKKQRDEILAKAIGEEVSQGLKKNNIQQIEIAKLLNLNNSDVSNRIHGKVRFTEKELSIINEHIDLPALERLGIRKERRKSCGELIEDIYVKYNKKQYEISNMKDISKVDSELAKLLYELLDELEGIL